MRRGYGGGGTPVAEPIVVQAMADTNQTLGGPSLAQRIVQTTGAITAARTLTITAVAGQEVILDNQCTGAFAIKVSPATGDLSANGVANGKVAKIYCDGTNWRRVTADATP